MSKKVQVQVQKSKTARKTRPADTAAPTVSKKLARIWFSETEGNQS